MSYIETIQQNTCSHVNMSISNQYDDMTGQHLSGFTLLKGLSLKRLEYFIKNGLAYAPVRYRGGHREYIEDQTKYLNTIIIDIDNDEQLANKELLTVKEAKELLHGYKYLIVSTKSSGVQSDKNPLGLERYRIILLLNRDIGIIDGTVYTKFVKAVVEDLGFSPYYDENGSSNRAPKFEPSVDNEHFFSYYSDDITDKVIEVDPYLNRVLKERAKTTNTPIEPLENHEVKKDIKVRLRGTGIHEYAWVSTLDALTSTHCPYEEKHKNGGSAFIVESKDGKKGVQCYGCGRTYWVEYQEHVENPIATFNCISSKVGVGKTYNAIKKALLADYGQIHIIVLPTIELVKQKYAEALNLRIELNKNYLIHKGVGRCFSNNTILFNDAGITEEIHSGDSLSYSAHRQLDKLLSLDRIEVIFMTHASFIKQKEKLIESKQTNKEIKIIVDEEILVIEDINITRTTIKLYEDTLGQYVSFFETSKVKDREVNETLLIGILKDDKRQELESRLAEEEGTLSHDIKSVLIKLLDENWKCYFRKSEIDALQRGDSKMGTYNLAMTAILDPKKFKDLDITFMIASFENTAFYHTWRAMGVQFNDISPSHLKSRENTTRPIEIHVMYCGDEVKDGWKPSRNFFDLWSGVEGCNNLNLTIKYINEKIVKSEHKVYYTVAQFFHKNISYGSKERRNDKVKAYENWKHIDNYDGSNQFLDYDVGVYLRTFNYNNNVRKKYIDGFNISVQDLESGRNMTKAMQFPRGLNRNRDKELFHKPFILVVPTMEYAQKLREYNFGEYKNVEIKPHTIQGITYQRPQEEKTPKEDKAIRDWMYLNKDCPYSFENIKHVRKLTKETYNVEKFNHNNYLDFAFKGKEAISKSTYYRNKKNLEFFKSHLENV